MTPVELELWHIASILLGVVVAILGVYARINMIWVKPAKDQEEKRQKERQKEREKFLTWQTSTNGRVDQLEKQDSEYKKLLDEISEGVRELKSEQHQQHSDMKELMHVEVGKLSEKMSARNSEIFAKIAQITAQVNT